MTKSIFTMLFLIVFSLPAQAIELKWMDTQGDIHQLSSEYKNQAVVLHFWASWCPPCVAEMPEMDAWLQQHPEVKILPISLDQDIATAKQFLAKNNIQLPALLTDQNQAAKMGIRGLPTTILVGVNGSIISSRIGAQDWQQAHWKESILALFPSAAKPMLQE